MVKLKIKKLIWDEWNTNHIKKHHVAPKEIKQVLKSKAITLKSYKNRFLILGKTKKKRLLTMVLALEKKGKYYLVTARPMSKKERRYYEKNS